jgi:hypothetical protein
LHSTNPALDLNIEKLLSYTWERQKVYTPRVFPPKVFWDMREKEKIDLIRNERSKRCEAPGQSEQNLKKGIQSMLCVFETKFSLEPLAIETNIPVRGVINQI